MIDRIDELKSLLRKRRLEGENFSWEESLGLDDFSYHWHYLEGFINAINEPFEIREAKARLNFYCKVPIRIIPGEAIVGQIDWNEPLVCLVANTHIRQEVLEQILNSEFPGEVKTRVQEMVEIARPACFNPFFHLTEEEYLVQVSHLAPSTFFNGHMVPDYSHFLQRGFKGVLEEIQVYRDRPLSKVESNFYDAMELTIQGLSTYINRYADLAQALLEEDRPAYDTVQLEHILTTCRHLAWEPAQDFPQALQMVWFLMCFVDYDSFGRFDQYLLPYYHKSLKDGMTEAEVLLWMKYAWIKIEECGAILNMTIGGRTPGGESAVNPLTSLCMLATRQMGFRSPNLSLRIRAGDSDQLWKEAHHSISSGQGLPALYNDDLIVDMLVGEGFLLEEALDYCLAGCSQVILPGRSNFACDVGCYNLLKALELSLHDGYDILSGKQVGPHTGTLEQLNSFTNLKQAYDSQMRYMTRLGVSINDKDMHLRQREGACVRSLTTNDCLARGKGFFHGGARYYNIQNEACGITNAANALHAIDLLVFQQQLVSLPTLVDILDNNWEGHEALRLRFKNGADKFGNDQADVDNLRASIAGDWYKEIHQYPAALGGFHWPGEVVFIYHEIHGAHTAASADGRRSGDPLASSAGAATGTDLSGPVPLLNSMLRNPQKECLTCCVLNMRFVRTTWVQNANTVIDLLRTYFSQGGFQVQINLVSREELIAARQDPQAYTDLVVRVGGFSDYYTRLSNELQLEILARTELELC